MVGRVGRVYTTVLTMGDREDYAQHASLTMGDREDYAQQCPSPKVYPGVIPC